METFETVTDYLNHAKPNDIIVFSGRGLIDGASNIESKYDTYKVHHGTTKTKLVFTNYRSRTTLSTNTMNQKVHLLTKEEFKQLKQ